MRRPGNLVAGALVAAAIVAAVAAGSRAPWTATGDEQAMMRLAWRARGERVEECRPLTEEERAERPVHMRREAVCEGRLVPYALAVSIDGRRVVADTLRGAGARQDRPIYVYREIPVSPGTHRLEVTFERVGPGPERVPDRESVPPALALERPVDLAPRKVVVVDYDPGARSLELVER